MIVIIDYGMGNLFSIRAALQYLGAESEISGDPDQIKRADKLILPGVGSFHKAMDNIKAGCLFEIIKESVNQEEKPILGICLGMQLLGLSSTEDGFCEGFGLIETAVERFDNQVCAGLKIPHVGFDTVSVTGKSRLLTGLNNHKDFYFTHSYRMAFTEQPYAVGLCSHGDLFIAAFEKEHICGTQFHPEKSQTNGLSLLKNFIEKF
ncbi:MAG: imidazole glycerol phosphate synthase subunit HisH [Syntrophales bacterium]|nr:imidazole glycerol phosphate synthase subunit HisH [Syntrophales bacterium]